MRWLNTQGAFSHQEMKNGGVRIYITKLPMASELSLTGTKKAWVSDGLIPRNEELS